MNDAAQLSRITPDHIAHYRQHGYAVVEKFLTQTELAGAQEDFRACMTPGWVEYALDASLPKPADWDAPRQHHKYVQFPYPGQHLNAVTVHPELRAFATLMMQRDDLYCEQSHLSYKCKGHVSDVDQRMHCDYGNHTLAYPPAAPDYWQTAYLVYYSDVTLDTAPTAVVSREHTPERIIWPAQFSREKRPEIYANEVRITVPAGSLLIYSMRTFHRGTPFLAEAGRLGQFITYAPAAWKWLGIVGWAKEANSPHFTAWIEQASVAERGVMGFPPPGHDYWTEETLDGVSARYPGMDMSPYRTS